MSLPYIFHKSRSLLHIVQFTYSHINIILLLQGDTVAILQGGTHYYANETLHRQPYWIFCRIVCNICDMRRQDILQTCSIRVLSQPKPIKCQNIIHMSNCYVHTFSLFTHKCLHMQYIVYTPKIQIQRTFAGRLICKYKC